MPWSNQSGGGGGGQGPWGGSGGGSGGGRGSGGGQPPDIEDLLRKGQERVRGMLPGGGGASPKIILLIVAVAVAVWLGTGFYTVKPGQQGVALIFGKVVDQTIPGLHYNLPAPIGEVFTPQVDESRRVDVGFRGAGTSRGRNLESDVLEDSLMLTSDQNIVDMDFTVLWRISNATDYLFNIRGQEATVKIVAESAMREVVGQTKFDAAVTVGREEIQDKTKALMQSILNSYEAGIVITNLQLQKSDPPGEVIDAFNDVQRARQDRTRLQNEAEAYANSIVPEARGLAAKDIQEATAYREQQIQEARGEADRFTSVYKAYTVAPEVTRKRMYLETIGAVLGQARKIIIDQKGGGPGVVPYLPLPEIQKRQDSNASSN